MLTRSRNSVRPHGDRVLFVDPFLPQGRSPGGVWIVHHEKIPKIFGQVTAVSESCREVRVDDWVVFMPNRPTRLATSGGVVHAISERELLAIIMAPDGVPWFAPEEEE